ncbi:hypothetical protein PBV87_20935 [Niameybacter massiliensis]|uniref:Uncharacterized protein n=1 Tax=Holtiella tumoricola TaxID=3018743 RepID=A0AA42DRG2_9FIRM|nr:hypothetical protein [Holtiella tumoricola]MDA3733943.1 hypothetical protein [Holtiella tumoricola]
MATIIRGQKFFSTSNPTEGLWDIEVGYVISEDIYIVKLTSTLRGRKYKYYKLNELYTKEAEVIHQLRAFGYMDKGLYAKVIDYIEYIRVCDTEVIDLDGTLDKYLRNEDIEAEANRAYEVLQEYVENNIDAFPKRTTNGYEDGKSQGVIFDDEKNIKKYDGRVLVIHKQYLDGIFVNELGIIGKGRHQAILEEWCRQERLFPTETGKEKRYQKKDLVLKDGMTGKGRKDGYVIRWSNLDEGI